MIGAIISLIGKFGLSAQQTAADQYMIGRAENAAELNNAIAWQNAAENRRNLLVTLGITLAAIGLIAILIMLINNSKK